MELSLDQIKALREKCGAGMVDCKKALEEAEGDIEKAVEILRKKGIAKAAKRGEREAHEGIIKIGVNEELAEGYMVELNSETDFVARNEKFQNFADEILNIIKSEKPKNLEELEASKMSDGLNLKDSLANLSGTIGEKLVIKRFDILSGGTVAAYSHAGGRIGVLVSIDKADQKDLAMDMAMQVAAANPKCINPEEVDAEEIDKEKEISREELKNEGKPDEIIEKILGGKINKYFEDICLTQQEYIKDDKKKVKDVLGDAKVEKFIRYSL